MPGIRHRCAAKAGRTAMAETTEVQVTGRSKYEMAHQMAIQIITAIEGKSLQNVNRMEYLRAHHDCIQVLSGVAPSMRYAPGAADPPTSA
jgi:hypothetical protein